MWWASPHQPCRAGARTPVTSAAVGAFGAGVGAPRATNHGETPGNTNITTVGTGTTPAGHSAARISVTSAAMGAVGASAGAPRAPNNCATPGKTNITTFGTSTTPAGNAA